MYDLRLPIYDFWEKTADYADLREGELEGGRKKVVGKHSTLNLPCRKDLINTRLQPGGNERDGGKTV